MWKDPDPEPAAGGGEQDPLGQDWQPTHEGTVYTEGVYFKFLHCIAHFKFLHCISGFLRNMKGDTQRWQTNRAHVSFPLYNCIASCIYIFNGREFVIEAYTTVYSIYISQIVA